ncbi:MAG TPA: AAA family ATPase, partial [Acidobacteriota bacterium]|nr:AAA family ATPase [Acidobacteriota bacterium]
MNAATAEVLRRLANVRPDGTGWNAKCPAHDDARNSLHVAEGTSGAVILHCHAGCDARDVIAKAGLKWCDLYVAGSGRRGDVKGSRPWGEVVATYDYVDEDGTLLYQVLRDEHKNFRQRRWKPGADPGEDAWIYNLEGARRLLYRLPEVVSAIALQKAGTYPYPIIVCEGEKDVDNVATLGLIATTNSGGSLKWTDGHTKQLAGARDVAILPDNDEPGLKHANAVAAAIAGSVGCVRILKLPDLPAKGDVSDWIAAGGTRDHLLKLAAGGEPFVPPSKRFTSIAVGAFTFAGRTYAKPRSLLGNGLLSAGDLAFLYGRPGLGKTWAALQFALSAVRGEPWFGIPTATGGVRAGILELELPAHVLQERLRAVAGEAGLSERDEGLSFVSRPHLRGAVDVLDNEQWAAWFELVRDPRLDVLIVDALSRVHHVDENHAADFAPVLGRFDELRHETGAAVVVVHHEPKPPSGKGFADDMDALRGTSRMASDANVLMRLARVGHGNGPLVLRFPKVNN